MYWMHKEFGYLLTADELFADAEAMGYDDITDPCSAEYGNYNLYYQRTNMVVA